MTKDEHKRLLNTLRKMKLNSVLPLVGNRYSPFFDAEKIVAVQETGKAELRRIQTNDQLLLSITDHVVTEPEDLFWTVFRRSTPKSLV